MFFFALNQFSHKSSPDSVTQEAHILELVEHARAGHGDSFDELVFHYRDQVFSTAWNLTRNHEDAMDVTQEAFLRVYKAISAYKGNSRFSTWLHRIVLNTAIDFIRREKRHRHESLYLPADPHSDTAANAARDIAMPANQREHTYQNELQKIVLAALDQLSTRQRQVFVLRYYHDLDTKETAKVIKCTEGSVKRHLFRAQLRLRELMRDEGLQNNDR